MKNPYSEKMHDAAEQWGIAMPNRPDLLLPPMSLPGLYQIPVVQSYEHIQDRALSTIEIVSTNDLWGYILRITLRQQGFSSGPAIGCDPLPSQSEAFDQAWNLALDFGQKALTHRDPYALKFLEWLGDIQQAQQPTLF